MQMPDHRLLALAAAKFMVDPRSIEFLRQSANAVYTCTRAGQPAILRLTSEHSRNCALVLSELDFMDAIGRNGGSVPKVYRSVDGHLVETLRLTEAVPEMVFHAALFEHVPGVHPEGSAITAEFLHLWGRTLGRMHRLSKAYRPGRTITPRPHWHEIDMFQLEDLIPADQGEVLAQVSALLDELDDLPTDRDAYGLIHADPEPWNMFWHDGRLTLIDFDDCCYHWFAFDVAVAVMYAYFGSREGDGGGESAQTPQAIWDAFYAGYREEHALSAFWLERIPLFLRLRVMEDYAFNFLAWDMDALDDWQRGILAYQRRAIETDTPPVDFEPRG